MPTYNKIENAWGPSEDEIDTVAEHALLFKSIGKIPTQPKPTLSNVLFHSGIVDHDFGSHLLSVAKLTAWAQTKDLELVTLPPIDGFRFVQVEALLCAIERAVSSSTKDHEAAAIVQFTPNLAQDRAAEIAPLWLVGADAHHQWRSLIKQAVQAGELSLLNYGSKLPIKETDTQLQAVQTLPADTEAAPAGTVTVWTPERKADARKMLDKLRSQGVRDFARRTAEYFNVSTTRLNTVLGKGKPQKKPKKITSHWSV